MKKTAGILALILIQVACQDTTKQLLNTIDGRWQLTTVTYTGRNRADSVAVQASAYLNFDQCSKTSNNSGPSACLLQISLTNQPFTFTYQAPNGGKALYISPTSQMADPSYKLVADRVAGSYEVLTLTDQMLIIRRSLQGSMSGFESVQYSATR